MYTFTPEETKVVFLICSEDRLNLGQKQTVSKLLGPETMVMRSISNHHFYMLVLVILVVRSHIAADDHAREIVNVHCFSKCVSGAQMSELVGMKDLQTEAYATVYVEIYSSFGEDFGRPPGE